MNKGTNTSATIQQSNFPNIKNEMTPLRLQQRRGSQRTSYIKVQSCQTYLPDSVIVKTKRDFLNSRQDAFQQIQQQDSQEMPRTYSNTPNIFQTQIAQDEKPRKTRRRKKRLPNFLQDVLGVNSLPIYKARSSIPHRISVYKDIRVKTQAKTPEPMRNPLQHQEISYNAFKRSHHQKPPHERNRVYDEYYIGGNLYYNNVKDPLYKPKTISLSPCSKIRLYSQSPQREIMNDRGTNRRVILPAKKSNNQNASASNYTLPDICNMDNNEPHNRKLAVTFEQKILAIQAMVLSNEDQPLLQQSVIVKLKLQSLSTYKFHI